MRNPINPRIPQATKRIFRLVKCANQPDATVPVIKPVS